MACLHNIGMYEFCISHLPTNMNKVIHFHFYSLFAITISKTTTQHYYIVSIHVQKNNSFVVRRPS